MTYDRAKTVAAARKVWPSIYQTRQLEGLWIGGAISAEAAEFVHTLLDNHLQHHENPKVRLELGDLVNAIRAELQKLPPPDANEDLL